jgi:anti-sigma factor RsiW
MRQTMTNHEERQLMRLLHGELPAEEAARWRQRLESESGLAAHYADLERQWSGLDLPDPAPAGPELLAAVRRRLSSDEYPSLADMWRLAPAWNRALAAVALAAGIAVGVLAGTVSEARADDTLFATTDLSLAESYWQVLEEGPVEAEDLMFEEAGAGEEAGAVEEEAQP